MNRKNKFLTVVILLFLGCGITQGSSGERESAATPTPVLLDIERYLGKNWYGIYFLDQKIGYAETEISRSRFEGKPAVAVNFKLHAKVAMLGVPQEISITENRTYVLGEGLVSFLSDSKTGGGWMEIVGKLSNGKMRITSIVGGEKKTSLKEIPRESFEDYIAEERLVREDAAVGNEITFMQYMPTLQKSVTSVSRVKEIRKEKLHGVTTKIYVIETAIKELGIVTTTLVDSDGDVLQAQVGGVFTMRLEGEKQAKSIDYRSDVLLSSVIRSKVKIKNPSSVKEMKAELGGFKDQSLLIRSERQTYKIQPDGNALLAVAVEDLSGVKIPNIPMDKDKFQKELSPSLFIQSDNPEIIALSKRIVGDERGALKISDKIVKWVYKNLKKRFSATFSNALDVLASGEGDCTEHSVLYVALARAAGLPAREVSGIMYSEEDNGFFYHQWAEAFVGKWIAVDPTFGQSQADATHIEFAHGDLFSQAKLINLIGSLSVKINEYGYKKGS